MFNPNSGNQVWSKWTFTVVPSLSQHLLRFKAVKENAARFGRKLFGSATEMRVQQLFNGTWQIDVRTEGSPAHDPVFTEYITSCWTSFLIKSFGSGAAIEITSKFEAGSKQDGSPAEQLILVPSIIVEELVKNE